MLLLTTAAYGSSSVARVAAKLFSFFTGGLLLPIRISLWPCFLAQLALYLAPAVGSLVFYFLMPELKPISWPILAYIGASFIFNLGLQSLGHHASRCHQAQVHVDTVESSPEGVTDRCDELTLGKTFKLRGFFSLSTWYYILQPRQKHGQEAIPRVLISVIISTASTVYLLPSLMQARCGVQFGNSAYTALAVFSWLAVCNALWSIATKAPIDINTYYTHDLWSLDDYTRSLHIVVLLAVSFVFLAFPDLSTNAGLGVQLVLCCMPLIWLLGIMPSFRVAIEWICEAVLIHANGGSPSYRFMMTFLYLVCSWGMVSVSFLLYQFVNGKAALIFASLAGFLAASRQMLTIYNPDSSPQPALFFLLVLLVSLCLAFLQGPVIELQNGNPLRLGSSIALWAIVGLQQVFQELSKGTLFFTLRNPLYTHVRQNSWFAAASVTLYCLTPIASFFWLFNELLTTVVLFQVSLYPYLNWIVYQRALRIVWQSPTRCAVECAIVAALGVSGWNASLANISWQSLDVGIQLLIVGLICYMVTHLALHVAALICVFLACFTDRKDKSALILWLALISLPLTLSLAVLASAIGAPLLQISRYPFFWIGFPRPIRQSKSFHKNYSFGPNSVFYSRLSAYLKVFLSTSPVIRSVTVGDTLVFSIRGLTVLVVVAERGFDYVSLLMYGLEPFPNKLSPLGEEVILLETVLGPKSASISPFSSIAPIADAEIDFVESTTRSFSSDALSTEQFRRSVFPYFSRALVYTLLHCVGSSYFNQKVGAQSSLSDTAHKQLPNRASLLSFLTQEQVKLSAEYAFYLSLKRANRFRDLSTTFVFTLLSVSIAIVQLYRREMSDLGVENVWLAYHGQKPENLSEHLSAGQLEELKHLVIKSWRMAVFLALECSTHPNSDETVASKLGELSRDWCFVDSEVELMKRLDPKSNNPTLNGFALMKESSSGASANAMKGLLVSQKPQNLNIGRVNSKLVASVWATDILGQLFAGKEPSRLASKHTFNCILSLGNNVPFGSPVWISKETVKLNLNPLYLYESNPSVAKLMRSAIVSNQDTRVLEAYFTRNL